MDRLRFMDRLNSLGRKRRMRGTSGGGSEIRSFHRENSSYSMEDYQPPIRCSKCSQSRQYSTRNLLEPDSMSADWFYMSSGWFHKTKQVGPLTDQDLLLRIDQG